MNKYGLILILICIVDLLITLIGIKCGFFKEANPVLIFYLEKGGTWAFVGIKLFIITASVTAMELSKHAKLISAKSLSLYFKITAIVYVLFWFFFTYIANRNHIIKF